MKRVYTRKPVAALQPVTRSGDTSSPSDRSTLAKHASLICDEYLRFVRSLPCSFCGKRGGQAHHWPSRGAMGVRDDALVCATCPECHRMAQYYKIVHTRQDQAVAETWKKLQELAPESLKALMRERLAEQAAARIWP